jgi:hypothetical protein
MKCSNCDKDAAFEYRLTLNKSVFYCGKDLPVFLGERKKAGLLKVTQQYKDDQKSALEVITTPNPVVEEQATEEAPKTKKKASTKKKTV